MDFLKYINNLKLKILNYNKSNVYNYNFKYN